MRNRYYRMGFILVLLSSYGLLFYFIFTHHQKLDFSAFYSTSHALLQGDNPYRNLSANYLPINKVLSANLNPPITLLLFSPLAHFTYSTALIIWSCISFVLGLIGVSIVFHYAFSSNFLQKNYLNLYLIYLAFFATLMNVTTLQFGTVLFCLIMLGYHFYLNNRNYFAGILWGLIIAMKLFPGLLFFYVIKQGRFKIFWIMLVTLFIAYLIPIMFYGTVIYDHYFSMIFRVHWYGDNWNASIYGFIFRLFIWADSKHHFISIEMLYIALFLILFLWYLKKLGPKEMNPVNHQPFCLTLAMMLLLSPLGWVYYFQMLLLPLILVWFVALNEESISTKTMFLWLVSFFLINVPLDYVKSSNMPNFFIRISFFSCYFYGLSLLTYLLGTRKRIYGNNEIHLDDREMNYSFMPIVITILVFSLSVPAICFVVRLLQMD